ncbi:MAG: type II toxin-antitoxin system VapC family toxin [Cyanobacteria bacterium P01_F01_bin.150]
MIYLLDTNVCIRLLNGDVPRVSQRLAELKPKQIRLCSIVQQELYYGAYNSAKVQNNLAKLERFIHPFQILPFDSASAIAAGAIQSRLRQLGTPIGAYDLQIAEIAIAHSLTLVTHNVREFSRIEELLYEDWEAEA